MNTPFKRWFLSLRSAYLKFINLGTSDSAAETENRLTRITNQVMLLGIIVTFLFLAQFLIFEGFFSKIHFTFLVMISSILICHKLGKTELGRLLAVFVIVAICWVCGVYFGKTYNAHYYLFVAMGLSVMLFSLRQLKLMIIGLSTSLSTLVAMDYLYVADIFPLKDISYLESARFPLMATDSIIASFMVISIVFFEKYMHERSEKRLNDLNEHLEQRVQARTKELKIQMHRVEQANYAKTQFLRNMSHEFRTPLNALINYSELSERELAKGREADMSKISQHSRQINLATSRISSLSSRILNMAEVKGGNIEVDRADVSIGPLVKEVVQKFSKKVRQKNLEIDFQHPNQEIKAFIDVDLFQETLYQLIENAFQYGNNGVNIALELWADDQRFFLTIMNEGSGIPEDEKEAIFDPFRLSRRTDDITGGVGLGLAQAKANIEAHGGVIEVTDTSPSSTEFRISVPLK